MAQYTAEQYRIIEGAYFCGFEPSVENLTGTDLYNEALDFLSTAHQC